MLAACAPAPFAVRPRAVCCPCAVRCPILPSLALGAHATRCHAVRPPRLCSLHRASAQFVAPRARARCTRPRAVRCSPLAPFAVRPLCRSLPAPLRCSLPDPHAQCLHHSLPALPCRSVPAPPCARSPPPSRLIPAVCMLDRLSCTLVCFRPDTPIPTHS
ncbi:hypothetical protein DFH08DRAFT_966858 [Mycena albidolilacea]|uniref:Uncharacterized protein n=1 Tax=Mycena albidolilacea TaxID=1033008 RepID=A0AAD6ZN79_9AGAR|nr:hypothetical protein DFH08DRAFT_966858 [Mycena albidolilacea]